DGVSTVLPSHSASISSRERGTGHLDGYPPLTNGSTTMIRAFSAVTELFLNSLDASHTRASVASQQISSGFRVNQASDSPGDVISIMDLETRIGHAAQVLKNLTGAQAEASAADKALQTAIKMMDQIDVIATQSLGISETTDTRKSL